MYDPIGGEEDEKVVQASNSLPLLSSRCKLTANGSSWEPLAYWMRNIDIFLHHNGPQTIFSHDNQRSHLLNVTWL